MVATLSVATLVPNHLSTVKNYQSTTSISHPYSSLFTTFTPPPTLHNKNHTRNGGEVKKRVAARGKKMKRSAEMRMRRRKRGVEKVREVHIDTNP